MSSLVVATPCEKFKQRVAGAYRGQLNGHRFYWRDGLLDGSASSVVNELTRTNPAVVAIGPDVAPGKALELARVFDSERPDVVVVLVATPSIALMDSALKSGARGVVAPDAPEDELRNAFEEALGAADRRRRAVAALDEVTSRHTICVVAPKGGAGKTTVSTNLASGLALAAPGEVVIVDVDFQFGDVASSLRITPEITFADISRAQRPVDVTTVKAFLTASDTGLFALCAPESPVDADIITVDQVRHVLSLLAAEFRYVIIDTASGIDEWTLAALKLSTDIVLLTSTDVPSVRATRKELEALDLMGLTSQTRHFVVNRADARVGLPLDEVEATVGMSVSAAIPSSRLVPISVNQGSPVVVSERKSGVGQSLARLVERFAPEAPPTTSRSKRKQKRRGDGPE
jgi:pilus assembly protein CpaE